jgi:acetyl-CoA synthetase
MQSCNIGRMMLELGIHSVAKLHEWSTQHREEFWGRLIEKLGIHFLEPCREIADLSGGTEWPRWFPGARLNIVDSCFRGKSDATAILYQREGSSLESVSLAELESLTNRVAHGLREHDIAPGDAVAIDMPMTVESVAVFLGIIRAGCVAVSIADSLASAQIAARLQLSNAKMVVTQDAIRRAGKILPLYEKVIAADAPRTVVFPQGDSVSCELRSGDLSSDQFLSNIERFESVPRDPHAHSSILFSSGTSEDPKTIPWTHTTPIKCASDGYLYHDIQPGDRVTWPTNLGWMMGPWLVFAGLINRATIALFDGAPTGKEFGRFIQAADVNILGVIPSLVKTWRSSRCMEDLNWQRIKLFSSTGECSNPEDMFYLMWLAGYKPIVEYCGGTEIGGGYIASTMVEPNVPSVFTTPALGLGMVLLDEKGQESDQGEVFIEPPSLGLSTELLHQDHHAAFYAGTPSGSKGELRRRHGDHFERLAGGQFRALGRVDDTMNLGGIKVSSAEIERVLNRVRGVDETAAVAISPEGGGPSLLWVFVVLSDKAKFEGEALSKLLQQAIRAELNPLFKIHEIEIVDMLPRTASNKVMRRLLRQQALQTRAK